jgi:hypothetical protein
MNIKAASELKRLKTRITKQTQTLSDAREQKKQADSSVKEEQNKLTEMKESLRKFEDSNKEPFVTEHALLRYCERVLGIDLEEAASHILSDDIRKYIDEFGTGRFPNNEKGFKVVVQNRQVVSVDKFKNV